MDRLYVVVRKDLPAGLQLAQAVHAGRAFPDPVSNDENVVVLHAKDEAELHRLACYADMRGYRYALFCEPDIGNEITAVSFDHKSRRMLADLPLAFK